jgi:pseudouridylate synthase
MDRILPTGIRIAERVSCALNERAPVVALESTVIAHGLPHPLNLDTALACEEVIRQQGATPATIGIVDGIPTVGLSEDEIRRFATAQGPDGRPIEKVSLNNVAGVMLKRAWGATTVASTLRLARCVGIRVFSTGGIGGVHRGAVESFDISADLTALGTTPLLCVCAGAKTVLDLPRTVECLETLGVPILGYRTEEFPSFYSRVSGLAVDVMVETPDEAAVLAECHWRVGMGTAVLVCVPVPDEFKISIADVERACVEAIAAADRKAIRGKALTPFLLSQIKELIGGDSLSANRALLANNAEVAARVAVSLSKVTQRYSNLRL